MSCKYKFTIYDMQMSEKTCEADLINQMLPDQALDPRRSKHATTVDNNDPAISVESAAWKTSFLS
jgi:hypothetical protein